MDLRIAALLSIVATTYLLADTPPPQGENVKKYKSTEAEKGYASTDIQKGWAFGEDPDVQKEEVVAPTQAVKGKCDTICLLTKMLDVQEKQLKEQIKIRKILEEQFDPKPHLIKREDGTECVANSSADCFEFPLIAEAKRVPVMANYLKNPHNDKAVGEWKKWFATYLNHTFDIGRATEYDTAKNGSNTFKTDYITAGYDSPNGHFSVEKSEHNSRLINALASKGLSLKIMLGKTPDLDLFAMDQIAMFVKKHPQLPVELVFSDRNNAEIYAGGSKAIGFIGQAFSQRNVAKRISTNKSEFPPEMQSTPSYMISYKSEKQAKEQIIKSGKVSSEKLAGAIIEWLIFEKIVDPAQLNANRVWKDSSGFGEKYIFDMYNATLPGGKKR